jgi:hypothetical protein
VGLRDTLQAGLALQPSWNVSEQNGLFGIHDTGHGANRNWKTTSLWDVQFLGTMFCGGRSTVNISSTSGLKGLAILKPYTCAGKSLWINSLIGNRWYTLLVIICFNIISGESLWCLPFEAMKWWIFSFKDPKIRVMWGSS